MQNVRLFILHLLADLRASLAPSACNGPTSQKAFARAAGVSSSFITQVLSREREPSQAVLDALGLRKIVRYRQVGSARSG
jgi:hypothetical protein